MTAHFKVQAAHTDAAAQPPAESARVLPERGQFKGKITSAEKVALDAMKANAEYSASDLTMTTVEPKDIENPVAKRNAAAAVAEIKQSLWRASGTPNQGVLITAFAKGATIVGYRVSGNSAAADRTNYTETAFFSAEGKLIDYNAEAFL